MTSLLTRIGSLEARIASQTIWNTGKRKRGDWICTDCRRRGALKQRRAYSDDSARLSSTPFAPFGPQKDDNRYGSHAAERSEREWNTQPAAPSLPWGLGREDDLEEEPARDDQEDQRDAEDQTSALWEQFEQAEEAAEEGTKEQSQEQFQEPPEFASSRIDYSVELAPALLQGSIDIVAECLLTAARNNDIDFIRSIPETSFSECIRLLQPSNFSEKYASAHLELSAALTKTFGITAIHEIVWENMKLLREIKSIRNSAGVKTPLSDYRVLLRAAYEVGSKPMMENLWASLLHDGHTPDTACYNYLMGANVFNEMHFALNRHRVRVIPFYQLARKRLRLGAGFTGYRIEAHGVKSKAMDLFSAMIREGAIANEESFRILMTALAREGDLKTVKSILSRMWNIDVEGLQNGIDDASLTPKAMDYGNPLRPTEKMLFTVAHSFSINNDIPTALRLVDFIARHYDLKIPMETWSQLFEWAFALSVPRTGVKAKTDGTREGQLPQQSVLNLWNTMTGAPYFIKPTMGMYNRVIKNLLNRDITPGIYEKMKEGIALGNQEWLEGKRAFERLERTVKKMAENPYYIPRTPLETLRREYDRLDLIRRRNNFFMRRWMRLLLASTRARAVLDDQFDGDWTLRLIPRMLWEARHLSGTANQIRLEIPGGLVEFQVQSEEELEKNRAAKDVWEERRRQTLAKVPLFIGEDWVFPKKQNEWSWQKQQ